MANDLKSGYPSPPSASSQTRTLLHFAYAGTLGVALGLSLANFAERTELGLIVMYVFLLAGLSWGAWKIFKPKRPVDTIDVDRDLIALRCERVSFLIHAGEFDAAEEILKEGWPEALRYAGTQAVEHVRSWDPASEDQPSGLNVPMRLSYGPGVEDILAQGGSVEVEPGVWAGQGGILGIPEGAEVRVSGVPASDKVQAGHVLDQPCDWSPTCSCPEPTPRADGGTRFCTCGGLLPSFASWLRRDRSSEDEPRKESAETVREIVEPEHGVTVRDLKKALENWPLVDERVLAEDGGAEVWTGTGFCESNQVKRIVPLNAVDMILESDVFDDHAEAQPHPRHVKGDYPDKMFWCESCPGVVFVWGPSDAPPHRCPECHGTKFADLIWLRSPTVHGKIVRPPGEDREIEVFQAEEWARLAAASGAEILIAEAAPLLRAMADAFLPSMTCACSEPSPAFPESIFCSCGGKLDQPATS